MTCRIVVNGVRIEYDDVRIGDACMEDEWKEKEKGLLKAELKRRNLTYKDLVDRFAAIGVSESEANLSN